jgi:hypothetical protein
MYDVQLHAAAGFGQTESGAPLVWSYPVSWPVHVWWPDESQGDPVLAELRRRLIGKNIYGYGGIVIDCDPRWFKTYGATAPIHVTDVQRDRGRLEQLWTGSTTHWGNEAAIHFFAQDPIRIITEIPPVPEIAQGGSNIEGAPARCPAIVLADWQVDATISTTAPPPLPNDPFSSHVISVGMSRKEVAWRLGYPNEFAGKSTMDREAVWQYKDSPLGWFHVTFRDDKVTSFTRPGMPP